MHKGVDVSVYQRNVDWRQLRIDAFEFFTARACDGTSVDPSHDDHIVKGCAAGFVGGSYQFGHPSMDVQACVDAFLKKAHLVPGAIRPVIDMETLSDGLVPENAAEWADKWCELVKTAMKGLCAGTNGATRGPIIYASSSYWKTMRTLKPEIGGPLGWDWWAAQYSLTAPSGLWVAWQNFGDVALTGQSGLWDLDTAPDIDRLRI